MTRLPPVTGELPVVHVGAAEAGVHLVSCLELSWPLASLKAVLQVRIGGGE